MLSISSFLEKFTKILNTSTLVRGFLIDIIKKEINYDIDVKNIKVQNGIVYLNERPIIKNEIFMKKNKILSELNQLIPREKHVLDIR